VVLDYRLIEQHFDETQNEENALLESDVMMMITQQKFWQRKLSELLVTTVLLSEKDLDDQFRAQLIFDRMSFRKNIKQEKEDLFDSTSRSLDLFIDNEKIAYEEIENTLKTLGQKPLCSNKIFKERIEMAFPLLKDHEKFGVGHYYDYRIRSGAIHAGTFPCQNLENLFDSLELDFTMTVLLARDLCVRFSRIKSSSLIIREVAEIIDPEINQIFERNVVSRFNPDIKIGDTVTVFSIDREYEGTVTDVNQGKYGGLSFKIDSPDKSGWYDRNCYHPASYVYKIDNRSN
jgi:hypothetical protein